MANAAAQATGRPDPWWTGRRSNFFSRITHQPRGRADSSGSDDDEAARARPSKEGSRPMSGDLGGRRPGASPAPEARSTSVASGSAGAVGKGTGTTRSIAGHPTEAKIQAYIT